MLGQPGYNAGDHTAARELAIKLTLEFADCDYVVVPSGSCAGMIRVHYPTLFPDDSEPARRVRALAARTYELTDFLVNIAKLQRCAGSFTGNLTYHDSCSGLRELGVKQQPRALLAHLTQCDAEGNGAMRDLLRFGGAFSVKFGEISSRMADNKSSPYSCQRRRIPWWRAI